MLDSRFTDEDADQAKGALFDPDDDDQEEAVEKTGGAWTASDFEARAAQIYAEYEGRYSRRFKWLRADLFKCSLEDELQSDSNALPGHTPGLRGLGPCQGRQARRAQLAAYGDLPRPEGAGVLSIR